jgi:hypothetical protein
VIPSPHPLVEIVLPLDVDDALENVRTARDRGWNGAHFKSSVAWQPQIEATLTIAIGGRDG